MTRLVATLGDTHSCPMVSGTVPHVGGTIITGQSNVLVNNRPVACMGDKVICANGSIATIVQGCPNVLVNGKPIAFLGCMTSHGGVITSGQPSVELSPYLGTVTDVNGIERIQIVTMPIELIDFPSFKARSKFLARKQMQEAMIAQNQLKKHGYLVDVEFSF